MSQEINISLVSKETPTVSLSTTASGDVQATVGDTTPIVSFIATGEKGATGATGSASIDDGSITNAKLASSSVSTSKIANASVSSIKLRQNAVTTTKIADHAVTAGKIALGSLTEALIDIFADGAIKPDKLKPGSLLEGNFADQSVGTNVIKNESVTAGKLANGIIETIKIVDNAITTAKIATNAVTGNEIQNSVTLNGTVTLNHLDLSGSSPAVIKGPDADALHIKTNTVVNFLNTSDTIVASVDQQGNLTLSGTVDGIDLAVAVPLNTAKVGITPDQTNAIIANTIKTGITTEQASAITANTAKPDLTVDGAGTVHPNNYTDTVYTHPANHPISLITGLQTALNAKQDTIEDGDLTIAKVNSLQVALNGKVNGNQVLTNVPINAVFTDTVYTHPANHAISVITGLQSALDAKQDSIGNEDLTIQQTDGLQDALDAKVDDSQVLTNVPANAVFTDTVYTHPTNHAISVITGLQSALDSKQDGIGSEDLTIAMTDGLQDALDAKVDDSQVLTNVPANAVFTDTNTTYSVQDGELSQNNFTDADHTKLNGIEANATADQTQADINALGITAVGIAGPTDGDVLISTDGSISVILDNDNDESNQHFEVRNSATGVVFLVNENGNVDVGGTVDGRDVAADGTKLDGIENGATADQTKTDIDALGIAATTAVSLTAGNKTIDGNLIITGTVDGIDIATDVAANTAKTSFPGFGTSSSTALAGNTSIPTQYTDALAVHAVENATLTLDNDLTVDSGFIYIHDQASTAKSRIGTETLTGNQTVYLPDASGTMALTNKTLQQFNLSFVDDISNLQHYLSWRDQYETSTNNYTDTVDTNYLVPANGRVKCVYIRVGSRTSTRTMTVKVYSQNAGFQQGQVEQEAEATSISSSDDFEVFAFYFDNAEHFQAGDSIKISVQDSADSGGTQTYNVTAVLEFDYTQMGRTTSGELA